MGHSIFSLPPKHLAAASNVAKRAFEALSVAPDKNPQVFHYTSIAGFSGIIESGTLRGTHTAFMNDSSEYIHGLELVADCLSKLVSETMSESQKLFYSTLSKELSGLTIESYNPIFVGCLTTLKNDLN